MILVTVAIMVSAQKQIPLLDTAPYDTIMDGKKVALYTISNGTVAAQITNYGGFIVSLFAPDNEGNYANLVTNYPNIHQYPRYNLGMVGPAGNFAAFSAFSKLVLSFDMLAGRLEFFPVLLLFSRSAWRRGL